MATPLPFKAKEITVHSFHMFVIVTCSCGSTVPLAVPLIAGSYNGIKCGACQATLKLNKLIYQPQEDGKGHTALIQVLAEEPAIVVPRL